MAKKVDLIGCFFFALYVLAFIMFVGYMMKQLF